jgi:hypothetical protein
VRRGSNILSAFRYSSLIVLNELMRFLNAWKRHPRRSPRLAILRLRPPSRHRLSSGNSSHRRHAARKPGGPATFSDKEKVTDLEKAIAAAAAAARTSVQTFTVASSL